MRGWIIGIGFIVVVGVLVVTSMPTAAVECEVCMEFRGEMVCRSGAGATEEEARTAAQNSTCGGNTGTMSDLIRCRNAEPERVTCTGG